MTLPKRRRVLASSCVLLSLVTSKLPLVGFSLHFIVGTFTKFVGIDQFSVKIGNEITNTLNRDLNPFLLSVMH
jgi:hypothetical protein